MNRMAYTGNEPDGGIGYVTADSPDVKSLVREHLGRCSSWVRSIF